MPRKRGRKDLHKLAVHFGYGEIEKSLREPEEIRVQLPAFQVTSQSELSRTFKSLGARTMFEENADFSEMASGPGVKLDKVWHQTAFQAGLIFVGHLFRQKSLAFFKAANFQDAEIVVKASPNQT